FVAHRLQCRNPRDIDRSRVLKTYTRRLQRDRSGRARTDILGKSTATSSEYFIAWFELSYVLTDCFDGACEIDAETGVFGFAQANASYCAHDVWRAFHEVPVIRINGRRANSYQDLVIIRNGLFNLLQLEVGHTIVAINYGLHRISQS